MNESIRPARAISPGRIILRELEERGWDQQDLASIMDRPKQTISEIVNAKKQITAETARQLAKAFGTSPDFWLNLEMQYQLHEAIKENNEKEIERRSKLFNLAPINEMAKRGWLKISESVDEIEEAYCYFFNISSVDRKPQIAFRLRVSEDRGPEGRSIVAWSRRAELLASEQKISSYSSETLPIIIENLLALSQNQDDISKIPMLLINSGIHFIIVPHLPKTFLDGAAFWVDKNPVIAMTLRYDRIDYFWFTLLHELAHILHNHQQIHVDQLFDNQIEKVDQNELEANQQVHEWLFPQEELENFIEWNRPRFSRELIENFARENKRHPGIVIGQLMHRNVIKYSNMREYLVKVKPQLEKWIDVSN